MREIRIATDWGWDRFDDLGAGTVPSRSGVFRRTVNLDELGKVHVCAEAFFHRPDVGLEPVRRDLRPTGYPLAKVSDKLQGARAVTLGDQMRDYQLGVRVNGDPCIGISPFGRIVVVQVSLFRMDERPKLIELNELRSDVADAGIQDGLALAARLLRKARGLFSCAFRLSAMRRECSSLRVTGIVHEPRPLNQYIGCREALHEGKKRCFRTLR
jgi:hypothetical protein